MLNDLSFDVIVTETGAGGGTGSRNCARKLMDELQRGFQRKAALESGKYAIAQPVHSRASSSPEEKRLVQALRRGDEQAFIALVARFHLGMVCFAGMFVSSHASAEDVVQETWLAVLRGIDRFEGRSSLKTWIYAILANRAKSRVQRERRSLPFSSLRDKRWSDPERHLLDREAYQILLDAIGTLPPAQREVITLRGIAQWNSVEVCNVLAISEINQRVLLHRARSKLRSALHRHRD